MNSSDNLPDSRLSDPTSDESRVRELELELIKTQAEAKAARLEARAAELELELRRMLEKNDSGDHSTTQDPTAKHLRIDHPKPVTDTFPTEDLDRPDGFSSWNEVRNVIGIPTRLADDPKPENVSPTSKESEPCPIVRTDSPHSLRGPSVRHTDPTNLVDTSNRDTIKSAVAQLSEEVALLEESGEESVKRKSRPAAFLASLVAHAGILFLLAVFTLSNTLPKDQVALSASISQSEEPQIETFSVETVQPETTVSETDPTETVYDVSEMGEMPITEIKPIEISGPPVPPMQSPLASSAMSASAMSMSSDSDSQMQFCGVEGGGNHFVYLVDSSGSMGGAFESARTELIDSIGQLKPDQRFYVVFFDAEPDFMRLANPNVDESRSVLATPQNKRALSQWAMTIKMDRGRAPYDPLKFAIGLKPDVIFLLSDGEFPQGIEDLLSEINRFDNLFGDEGPISLVHTIGYHSREGETRMKRIAKQNGGQYRHVPKP